MSVWSSAKAKRVKAALKRLGWQEKRQRGTSHCVMSRDGWADFIFAFHDAVEIGPVMLARLARHTGLKPEDL
ncbi:hypothetical protein FACS1894139_10270 [Planctomycetales bacterium]|nr:hypothetical protein FACS1894107_14900 [Planctomycetales bacterium]GHS97799.1 hypothetical protein FACS1894108_04790 [Planctomycetales bacterium]GHT05796.1 hypothetical protein FACS1894139_10270 [Planctomycetales bacterium]